MAALPQDQWTGKCVTVMGLGLHGGGLAVATWMLHRGACVTVTDLKTARELREPVSILRRVMRERGSGTLALVLGQHRARDFRDVDLVVQNPGVPRESKFLAIARAARVPIENEASLFLKTINVERKTQNAPPPHAPLRWPSEWGKSKFLPLPQGGGATCPGLSVERGGGAAESGVRIIGVTGTRGKSTTTALIHAMLRQAGRAAFLAGNIRIPMFGILDRVLAAARRGPVDVVLELSSWHCERLSAATGGPDVAVLTNLYSDHLNRYPSMRSYAAAKTRLVRFQNRSGIVIANAEQPIVRAMAALTPGSIVWFSSRAPRRTWSGFAVRDGECVRIRRGRASVIAPRALLRLPGTHNTMNLLAATAAATVCGVHPLDIRRALRSFHGLPGRLETIAQRRGVTFVNDTCATSPDGTIAALLALSESGIRNQESGGRSVVLIAGGTDKNLEFDQWARVVAGGNVRAVVFLPGTATKKMLAALRLLQIPDSKFQILHVPSMRAAVRIASLFARVGDVVLLSPGAASFGLFRHEFDRGDQFVKAIRT